MEQALKRYLAEPSVAGEQRDHYTPKSEHGESVVIFGRVDRMETDGSR